MASLLKFIVILNHIVKWELCAWCWLCICFQGSILVSVSINSPTLVNCSWFLVTTLNPYLTKQDDGKLISFYLAKILERGYFLLHSSDSHIIVPLILTRVFTSSSCCNSHNSCCHCSDTADKSNKSGWVNQEGNSIAFQSWNLSLKSWISISTCATVTVFAYLVLSHSFNQENWT